MASTLFRQLHDKAVCVDCAAMHNLHRLDFPKDIADRIALADDLVTAADQFFASMAPISKQYSTRNSRVVVYLCPVCRKESCGGAMRFASAQALYALQHPSGK